jgi:hypothetical protein
MIAIAATPLPGFAQCFPPDSPCTNAWIPGPNFEASVGEIASTCSATITFQYRQCNGFVEMMVTNVTFSGTGCSDLTSAEIFDRALYLLILERLPEILGPKTDKPNWKIWKITRPGCIRKATTANTDDTYSLTPCNTGCCTTNATIEYKESCNQYVFGWQYPYSFPPVCPPQAGVDGCKENCSVNIEHAFDRSRYPR